MMTVAVTFALLALFFRRSHHADLQRQDFHPGKSAFSICGCVGFAYPLQFCPWP
jgi:hypothetical protein